MNKEFGIVISGDRDWTDGPKIAHWISEAVKIAQAKGAVLPKSDIYFAHGACRGVDLIADEWLRKCGFKNIKPFPADWNRYKKAAGPIRNQEMLEEMKPDLVIAFHGNLISGSRGTRDCVERANRMGIPVWIIS